MLVLPPFLRQEYQRCRRFESFAVDLTFEKALFGQKMSNERIVVLEDGKGPGLKVTECSICNEFWL
jgi:hypothetical protein